MIELKNITKTFYQKDKEINALSNVSLFVSSGEIFGVIGTSGAGKSTLIRSINLLEKPTSGEVVVDGINLTGLSSSQLAKERRHIGMIFQNFNLLSSRTVFENIAFPLELDGLSKSKIKERVYDLLTLTGLLDKADDYPANLSGGQKQRVAIARTLASNPKVLLCDEATSALDPATTKSILTLLKDINKRLGITILLITHEMNVVKSICDSVAVISDGKLIEQGSVAEVFLHPKTALAKEFIASSLNVEVPVLYKNRLEHANAKNQHPLLKLELTGKSVDEPVLSQAARLFDVDTKIITAQMDQAGDASFGVILVELSGNPKNCQEAIHYFIDKHIIVEIVGYV